MCRYKLGLLQKWTGICADTNSICPDTDKNTFKYIHEYIQIHKQKYVHKYVLIPPVHIQMYLLQICTEYVHVKLLMIF